MKKLCIVPCGKKKVWDSNPGAGPTRAEHVYVGPFSHKCQEYARKYYPASWRILSAKYGFLKPDDIIPESYNVSFNDKKTKPIGVDELKKQAIAQKLNTYHQLVVLGGKNYVRMISMIFNPKHIKTPLACILFKSHGYLKKQEGRLNNRTR